MLLARLQLAVSDSAEHRLFSHAGEKRMNNKTNKAPALRCEAMVRLSLPSDVCRCFGGGCADKEHCQRYIARNERWPELSYIQGGAFVNGVCLYRIEPNTPDHPRE